MARARNIKPGFFSNDQLVELPFETRLLFIGLWTIADRAGRLLDRPKKIKMDIFPGDSVDCDAALESLASSGFIRRYDVDGVKAIQIINWDKHQNPHCKEAESTIPKPSERRKESIEISCEHRACTMQEPFEEQPRQEQASFLPERAGLIPDPLNLIPDSPSLIPSLLPPPASPASAARKPKQDKAEDPALQEACFSTWRAYSLAYLDRYGTKPVRNAKVNKNVMDFVKRLGYDESPQVAAFFLTHQGAFYIQKCHDFGVALADAEKLRTEWATNRKVTGITARQQERTGTMADTVQSILLERGMA